MKRAVAVTLVGALLLGIPGPECWAQVGRAAGSNGTSAGTPVLGNTGMPAVGGAAAPSAPAVLTHPSLTTQVSPVLLRAAPKTLALGTVAPAAGNIVSASGLAGAAGGPAAETLAAGGNSPAKAASPMSQAAMASQLGTFSAPIFENSRAQPTASSDVEGREGEGAALLEAPSDLKMSAEDAEAVSQFTASFHAKVAALWPDYQFTVRDYYAWARYLRFFTPSVGVKEAIRAGAAYVYGDRLELDAERTAFDRELASAVGSLRLARPEHGKDAALAKKLLALAEPTKETLDDDEESPFRVPLSGLVPSKESTNLVLTPTTLRRVEAAWRAFAMRDYALLLGPPATEKSAIPKYLAAENGVPYLAVTMHPGIGTFELVGGYRAKVVRITNLEDAKRIVRAKLRAAEESGDWSEFVESGAKVYAGGMEASADAAKKDLEAGGRDAERRIKTLAHGLEYGAASLVWQDGFLTYALKRDIWISFEEINAAPTESQEFLNDFMRTRRLVVTQKMGEPQVLEPKAGGRFMLWATMNPETDPNREVLSQTLKNRWRVKHFGDLPAFEQAEIIEKKYGIPTNWAIALVENFHKELRRQSRDRVIGDQWRDGYEINLRHLMKVSRRWRRFVDLETRDGRAPDKDRQLFLLGREAYSVYGGLMRAANERAGVFVLLDQALKLSAAGIRSPNDVTVRPDRIEDLGDRIRIGDVELPKGKGGAFTPRPNPDYLAEPGVYARLYEYAKALAMGEPVLVMGDSAAGKTSDLEYLFFRLNRNLRYKNLDTDSAIEEVIGGYAPGKRRGQYAYQEGMLPAAMEEGSGAFLDEFNLNPLVEWLNTVIDDGKLYLPERIVEGRPLIVAAANPPDPRYPGRILLSPATRSRYTEIWVDKDDSVGRLTKLMGHWLQGGTAYAAVAGLFLTQQVAAALHLLSGSGLGAAGRSPSSAMDSLKRLFGVKKKSSEDSDDATSGPPSLDEVFKTHKIAAEDQPMMRAKIARVEMMMRMVGGSVGRDSSLKWAPGDLWAYFPQTNTATYPVEHLVTHSEEELLGVIDHEALHRETTVLDDRLALVRKYVEDPVKHFLWNGMEDPRVNSRGIHRLPGAERYLHALYDRYLPRGERRVYEADAEAPDASTMGDGATAFDPKVMQFPHIEYVMAANYWWRHGTKPTFMNKSAEAAFDKSLPDLQEIFKMYPEDADPTKAEAGAYTLAALKKIDEKLLPLYEPLVQESQKRLSKMKKGGKKGKGKGGPGNGMSDPNSKPQPKEGKKSNDDKKNEGKPGDERKDEKGKDGKNDEKRDGKQEPGDDEGEPDPDSKESREARREIENHARRAAESMRPQVKENPTGKDVQDARDKAAKKNEPESAGKTGESAPAPLSIEEIAETQRRQILERQATPYQNAYAPVAHLANPMVTHLENIFLKNSRPRDVGYYRTGKRPDMKRAMKREGEGGVRNDVMLRRTAASKRRYKVTLLVDESGSMDAFRREAIQTVVLFVDALARLQIDVEVIGFNEKARIHKQFSEPLTPAIKDRLVAELQEHLGNGNTHDADAVKLAVERILREDADERYVFVVTDGRGNGPSSLTDVLPSADKQRVHVMGVGVGEGMAYVKEVYPRHAAVETIAQLPKTLRDKLVESISRAEHAARSAAQHFLPGSGAPAGTNLLGSLPAFFLPVAFFGALWAAGVLLAAPALASPLAVLGIAAPVFIVLKAWFPDAGPLGMVTVIAGLTGGSALPLVYTAWLAPLLGLFFAAESANSITNLLRRTRAGGKDTAILAFLTAASFFPV
ncbi:MAG: AAA family ATPase, partial [Elusimicrobia bacterium]|nr:AAA family ATPase [Elusimicrobiota bacterium]